MAGAGGTGRALLSLSFSSPSSTVLLSRSLFSAKLPLHYLRPLSLSATFATASSPTTVADTPLQPLRHSMLLDRIRSRHLKDATSSSDPNVSPPRKANNEVARGEEKGKKKVGVAASSFSKLGLSEEVMGALKEMEISVPTEIQCIGVPAVLERKSVVLGSHTGSGKTLAYMLPLVQLLRYDEALYGRSMKPRRPRAVVLCPTRELCEQVFRVAKSVSHHARFRSTMISGGGRSRPQEDSLNVPTDMVVGTPGRILQHIEVGNMVFGDIKYLVLDEADTMFDHGFGPDIRKFLGPLKARASKPNDPGFQIVLVAATMTKAVQRLVDEEFQGIKHLRTSSLHKKVASARHDFIKLSASENKLEALLQVLEPSLARGNRVMVFCNTLKSSRAVDHFLAENQIFTVNYHGEVPAEQRVENLKKFKSDVGDCPTLVCTDLAARGLDLDVDHVIMFDFPLNSIDYLHRTGRTARMGAKGKVTSFVDKKDALLASRIEEAIKKNESFESLNAGNVRRDVANSRQSDQKGKFLNSKKVTVPSKKMSSTSSSSTSGRRAAPISSRSTGKQSTSKSSKVTYSKPTKAFASVSKGKTTKEIKVVGNRKSTSLTSEQSKLRVVGFRGRSSSIKEASRTN